MGNCCNNNEMFFCLRSVLSCSQKQSEFARLSDQTCVVYSRFEVRGSSGRFSWYQSFGLQSPRIRHIRTERKNSSEMGLVMSYKDNSSEIGSVVS